MMVSLNRKPRPFPAETTLWASAWVPLHALFHRIPFNAGALIIHVYLVVEYSELAPFLWIPEPSMLS